MRQEETIDRTETGDGLRTRIYPKRTYSSSSMILHILALLILLFPYCTCVKLIFP